MRNDYRYGFQGQEKDNEIKGKGNSVNYKYRMRDARLGRFFAVDPLAPKYPHYSPYQFSGNKLIHAIELEGLEEKILNYTLTHPNEPSSDAVFMGETKNTEMRSIDDGNGGTKQVKWNIRKNEAFDPAEEGTVQYQYYALGDKAGNLKVIPGNFSPHNANKPGGVRIPEGYYLYELNAKRNYKGMIEIGEGDILTIPTGNLFGTIYAGANNPMIKDANGIMVGDYRYEPLNLVDAGALQHDMNYEALGAAGVSGVLSKMTANADERLMQNVKNVMTAYTHNLLHSDKIIDMYTGKAVDWDTYVSAWKVNLGFVILSQKAGVPITPPTNNPIENAP